MKRRKTTHQMVGSSLDDEEEDEMDEDMEMWYEIVKNVGFGERLDIISKRS